MKPQHESNSQRDSSDTNTKKSVKHRKIKRRPSNTWNFYQQLKASKSEKTGTIVADGKTERRLREVPPSTTRRTSGGDSYLW